MADGEGNGRIEARLRGLVAASRIVVEELELAHVLQRILDAALRLVGARYAALGVIDEDGERLEQFLFEGMSEAEAKAIGHLPRGHGLLGAVIEAGRTIRLPDLQTDARSTGFPAHHPPMRAFLGVPIRVRGQVFGNLYLADPRAGAFEPEDEEIVEALAATAGIAIENARLYEEARGRERLSLALAQVTAALLSSDSGDALGVVADRAAALTGATLVAILTPEADGGLRVAAVRGDGAQELEHRVIVPEAGALASITEADHASVIEDATTLLGEAVPLASAIVVPLDVEGSRIGALCIARPADRPRFSQTDVAMAGDFAAQAGLAVALAWARIDRQRLELVEDRARTARDLHDHVIQRLFGAGLGLQAIAYADPAHAPAIARHIAEIDAAIADIRQAVFTLQRPAVAADGPQIRHRLLDVVAEASPLLPDAPRLTFAGPVDLIVTGTLAEDVVAVVRESLANVGRHAAASWVAVDVTVTAASILVTVDDDGIGVAPAGVRASGTANLAARAAEHGGEFTLLPRVEGGTRAQWRVPVSREAG